MNLHGLVAPVISSVNPSIPATFQASAGSTQNADFSQTPAFASPVTVNAQVQELSMKDLMHLEGLNIQGSNVAIYLYGSASGVVRVSQKGGDLITISTGPNAGVYLTTAVLERWPNWTKIAGTLQNQAV